MSTFTIRVTSSATNVAGTAYQTNGQPVADPVSEEPQPAPVRNEPQAADPRRRLRELLAIPDHQRTDAIWDEIIELEISLAPGNRIQGSPGA